MTTMHFTEKMTATPEQFVAALTDFGKGREKIWGNSADNYLKVAGYQVDMFPDPMIALDALESTASNDKFLILLLYFRYNACMCRKL